MSAIALLIESLAHGGDGVASLPGGKRVFVPGAAPGDRVEAEVVEERPALARARLLRVVEPGPARVEPPCPHYASCGGCQLQHLSAPAQLEARERAFYEALARIGGLRREQIAEAASIVPSPDGLGYRVRARLHVRSGKLGYLRRGSHELEPIAGCMLLAPALERLVQAVGERLAARPLPALREIDACIGADGGGAIALHPDPKAFPGWADKAPKIFEGIDELRGIVVMQPPPRQPGKGRRLPPGMPAAQPRLLGDPVISRPAPLAPGVQVLGRPDVFAQANAAANEALVRAAVERLAPTAADQVLELYCGAGNFTFALAARSARVVAVEFEGVSLDLARRAAGAARVENVRFVAGDAAKVAQGFAAEGRRFDLALLDPPRSGARGVPEALAAIGPRRIAWVSCDPATLARDLAPLLAAGYRVRSAVPVDMFPQTFHVEGVVLLERG